MGARPYQVVGQSDEELATLSGDLELGAEAGEEYSGLPIQLVPPEIRAGFVRKVFCIIGLQLLLTAAIAAPLVGVDAVRAVLVSSQSLLIVCMIGSFGTLCAMMTNPSLTRTFPTNVGLLAIFTVFEAVLVSMIVAQYELTSVLLSVFVTALAVLGVTAFAATTQRDFTSPSLCCMSSLWYFVLSGFILLFFPQIPFIHLLYAVGGSVLFSAFLVFDVQRIIGGAHHKHEYSVDDYVLAALTVYLDIINIFLYLLEIFGNRRE